MSWCYSTPHPHTGGLGAAALGAPVGLPQATEGGSPGLGLVVEKLRPAEEGAPPGQWLSRTPIPGSRGWLCDQKALCSPGQAELELSLRQRSRCGRRERAGCSSRASALEPARPRCARDRCHWSSRRPPERGWATWRDPPSRRQSRADNQSGEPTGAPAPCQPSPLRNPFPLRHHFRSQALQPP